ncbi:MAG: SDR family oxidoreductase [Ewingella americana]|jgi:short-subunit dehydrogenase|uniref:SDR family NAD(P)-dependent oxidoreductase n=1 Tax=Ewingella americana TaxID=41202 RepID=UPI00242BD463|nr:SDR family oxidoreductase [Ewingella americana]MCI1678471.1 SDR family oxidoreductase [Ewingella americana]MCI1854058.1 SDR family oxidoreductase [Ewingella americana]MCI1861358.1 SDR family oxidoreductase [Ewingella americana]MCI2143475.1 SDR family oxidoreductase [Ewingella americana]MCI2163659.1 SDR family oxidoreductase [Ewingella americana]
MTTSTARPVALITGASTGIGAIYADRLARRGYDLILVARNQSRLEKVADIIKESTGADVSVIAADLGQREGLRQVEALLRREDSPISLLVNNAGFGSVFPLLNANVDEMEQMIELNVTALTRLTYAAVPGFVARGNGAIINISSIVAISTNVLNDVYNASKAYVLNFTQSLHHQLADKGVKVQAVLPGATATEFWDVAGTNTSNLPQDWVMSAEDMVDASLRGFDQGEVVTIPPLQDGDKWLAYDAARVELSGLFANKTPGPRYL